VSRPIAPNPCPRSRVPKWVGASLAFALFGGCQVVPVDFLDSGETGGSGTEPTPDPVYNCDPGDENSCGADQKCTALDNAGTQNLYDCVDDDGTLAPFGGCTVAPMTGQDGCPRGHGCMPLEDGGAAGFCLPLCRDDADCTNATCIPTPHVDVPVCADHCNPLVGACPVVTRCLPDLDRYLCRFPDGDDGAAGDSCDGTYNRGCDEGLACQQGLVVNDCSVSDCCTPLCDLDAPTDPCTLPSECVSLFADPAPDLENVGVCITPQ
jgi:hypothetical protein